MSKSDIEEEILAEISGKMKKLENLAYHEGYNDGLQLVYDAIDWFHSKYGSEYILYDTSSIKHLLEIFTKEIVKNVDNDAVKEHDS